MGLGLVAVAVGAAAPITDWRMSAPPACYHFGIVCVGPGDFTYHRSWFFVFVVCRGFVFHGVGRRSYFTQI